MKRLTLIAFVVAALGMPPAQAGKWVSHCRDANGNPVFSDRGCPREAEAKGTYYTPNAQGVDRKWSESDVNMLNKHEREEGTGRHWYRTQRPR